jgi:hypothetical protein
MIYSKVKSIYRVFKNGNKRKLALPRKESSGYGVEGYFIKLKNGQGLKLFEDMEHAQRSHDRQFLAWDEERVAPKVLSQVSKFFVTTCTAKKHKVFYGYKTQVAMTDPCEGCNRHYKCSACPTESFYLRFSDDEDKADLMDALDRLCLGTHDLHTSNIGLIGKRLVCIDFGDVSSNDETT